MTKVYTVPSSKELNVDVSPTQDAVMREKLYAV